MQESIYFKIVRPLMGLILGMLVGFFGVYYCFELVDFFTQRKGMERLVLQTGSYRIITIPLCGFLGFYALGDSKIKKSYRILMSTLGGLIAVAIGYKICLMVCDWYGYPIKTNTDVLLFLLAPFFALGIYLGNGGKWPDDDLTSDGDVYIDID